MTHTTKRIFISVLCVLGVAAVSFAHAQNPYLYILFDRKEVAPGSEFFADVYVSTDVSINALEAEIEYSHDTLEFVEAIDAGSIITVWVPKTLLSSRGTVIFGGGITSLFQGSAGKIVRLRFLARREGDGVLTIQRGTLYAADGSGTRIPVEPSSFTVPILEGAASGIASGENNDITAPEVAARVFIDPLSGEKAVVVEARDAETGVRRTQIRMKRWFRWGAFEDATYPVGVPGGVWALQVKSENTDGITNENTIILWKEIWKKAGFILFFAVVAALVVWGFLRRKKR